jgi:DNA-binding CsgD family transcriptional regulator
LYYQIRIFAMYNYYKRRKRKMITVYLDTKDSILLKSKDATFHVLYYILNQTDMERNTWYADKENKQRIMDKLGISPPTLDKHIASLKKRKLILTTETRGKYMLNMSMFST